MLNTLIAKVIERVVDNNRLAVWEITIYRFTNGVWGHLLLLDTLSFFVLLTLFSFTATITVAQAQ